MPEPKTADATFTSPASDAPDLHLFVYREDNNGKRVNAGGYLYHELRINCPKCGESNLLCRWLDMGSMDMAGDLTCNKCGKPMVKKEADHVEVDIDMVPGPGMLLTKAEADALIAATAVKPLSQHIEEALKEREAKTATSFTQEQKDAIDAGGRKGAIIPTTSAREAKPEAKQDPTVKVLPILPPATPTFKNLGKEPEDADKGS